MLKLTNTTQARRNILTRFVDVMPGKSVEVSDEILSEIQANPVDAAEFLSYISGANPIFKAEKL